MCGKQGERNGNYLYNRLGFLKSAERLVLYRIYGRFERKNDLCQTKNRPYLVEVRTAEKKVLWMRPNCKLWSCHDCSEDNKKRWLSIIIEGMNDINNTHPETKWCFCTMTAGKQATTNAQAIKHFREDWPKLQRRMKREYGTFDYVIVPELGEKRARYHQHMICSVMIKERWLKDNCAQCGLGYIADSQEAVNPGLVAFYCAKYITKSLSNGLHWPKTLHRIRTSRTWPRREIEPFSCEISLCPVVPKKFDDIRYEYGRLGYSFVDLTTGVVVDATTDM